MSTQEFLQDGETRMRGAQAALQRELSSIRTGRASPALVDHISVEYYGAPTPLNQLASIVSPEARLLVIQPWDKQAIGSVERALLKSDLGITPNNDGTVIRLVLPMPTAERRKELVRVVRKRVEDGRVAVRNVRRDVLDKLRAMERAKELSQDEARRAQERLQQLTDFSIGQIDETGAAKEAEVLEG